MVKLFQHIKPFQVFLLLACLSFAPAFNLQREYIGADNPDMFSYLQMAEGDYNTSPIRRYRWVIPSICQVLSLPVVMVQPEQQRSILRFAFFVVNWSVMAFGCTILFLFLKRLKIPSHFAFLATILILLSRWGIYFSSIPIVDSLYFLCIVALCYGIVSENKVWVWLAVLVGPIAKESLYLFIPLLYFANHLKWMHRILAVIASVALFSLSRYIIDSLFGFSATESITADLNHFENIFTSLKLFLSPTGIKEVFMVLGLAWVIPLFGIKKWRHQIPPFLYAVIIIAFVHALLSTSIGRMLFLAFPFWAWAIAQGLKQISEKYATYSS